MRNLNILKESIFTVFVLTTLIFQAMNYAIADTMILDNGQSGTSYEGTWRISNGVEPYASNSLYASTDDASYTFTIDLPTPGEYQVFARWTEYHNRRSTVPYDIIHKAGTNTLIVNQQQNGGTWQKLGSSWTFSNQATIRIRSLGNGTTSADAIKLVYVPTNTAFESDGAAQTGSVVLNWTAPVARADGTALALSEIASYTIYYGTVANNYPNSINIKDGSATSINITGLPPATYYMVATTRDYNGRESIKSSMVTKLVK